MNAFVVGLYGLFFVMVGVKMRSGELVDEVKQDVGGFVPWALAIAVLAIMYEVDETKPIVKPFALLIILNFVLVNFGKIQNEFRKITK